MYSTAAAFAISDQCRAGAGTRILFSEMTAVAVADGPILGA